MACQTKVRQADPTGNSAKTCQSSRAKIFRFIRSAAQCINSPSHPIEGRFAVVTNVGRDAVDAERVTDEIAQGGRRNRAGLTP
jgi:hypothetical protein